MMGTDTRPRQRCIRHITLSQEAFYTTHNPSNITLSQGALYTTHNPSHITLSQEAFYTTHNPSFLYSQTLKLTFRKINKHVSVIPE